MIEQALAVRKSAREALARRYTYKVAPTDGECVGTCAEFPSLSWVASDPDGAFRGIRRVVLDVLEDMQMSGETIPMPVTP